MKWKEVAKFGSGAEAFHALVHLYFWLGDVAFPVFGIQVGSRWNAIGVVVNGIVSVALGLYAWRPSRL